MERFLEWAVVQLIPNGSEAIALELYAGDEMKVGFGQVFLLLHQRFVHIRHVFLGKHYQRFFEAAPLMLLTAPAWARLISSDFFSESLNLPST